VLKTPPFFLEGYILVFATQPAETVPDSGVNEVCGIITPLLSLGTRLRPAELKLGGTFTHRYTSHTYTGYFVHCVIWPFPLI